MEPWLSWGIALVMGGLAFYYYNSQQKKPQGGKTRASSVSESAPPAVKPARRESRAKPKAQTSSTSGAEVHRPVAEPRKADLSSSAAESGKKRKVGKKQPAPVPAAAPAIVKSSAPVDDDYAEEDDNKAWAEQLLSLKKGTSLAAPVRTDSRNRTVKQSAAGVTPTFSSASSNAADADDDWTPARSPALAAGGVSDMLEPTPNGPSVLRLTESSKPAKATQQRQQKSPEATETKKQRQNRKKVEERKLQREAEEKERQVLLENQRRVARESRGEPARNGVPAKAPAVSEWAVKAATRATQAPAEAVSSGKTDNSTLLDTFDEADTRFPSEEDQLNFAKKLSEDESGWNTVPKGKKQKKGKTAGLAETSGDDTTSAPSVSHVQTPVPTPAPVAAPVKDTIAASQPAETKSNGYSPSSFVYDAGSHPEDSAWSA